MKMSSNYKTGWAAAPGQKTKMVWTIPLDAGQSFFDPEFIVGCLGNEVKLTLTGLKLDKLVDPDGIDTGVVVIDRSRVKEHVNGNPVFDSWVIYNSEDGAEIGIEFDAATGGTIRIFLDPNYRFTVQALLGERVRVEVKRVKSADLDQVVLQAAGMEKIDLRLFVGH